MSTLGGAPEGGVAAGGGAAVVGAGADAGAGADVGAGSSSLTTSFGAGVGSVTAGVVSEGAPPAPAASAVVGVASAGSSPLAGAAGGVELGSAAGSSDAGSVLALQARSELRFRPEVPEPASTRCSSSRWRAPVRLPPRMRVPARRARPRRSPRWRRRSAQPLPTDSPLPPTESPLGDRNGHHVLTAVSSSGQGDSDIRKAPASPEPFVPLDLRVEEHKLRSRGKYRQLGRMT